ncbi:MAG: PLP-dependent cysteine synthase family protein, partial [Sphingomonadaceae bacterium]
GTNIWVCAQIAQEMAEKGQSGSIVSILCDDGERYRKTYFDDHWLAERAIDIRPWENALEAFFSTGSARISA